MSGLGWIPEDLWQETVDSDAWPFARHWTGRPRIIPDGMPLPPCIDAGTAAEPLEIAADLAELAWMPAEERAAIDDALRHLPAGVEAWRIDDPLAGGIRLVLVHRRPCVTTLPERP